MATTITERLSGSATLTAGPTDLAAIEDFGGTGIPERTGDNTWSLRPVTGANDALAPLAADGLSLGTAALPWSDLFFAAGGAVDWGNGDVTLSHAANTLSFAGATNGYVFDGTLAPAAMVGSYLGLLARRYRGKLDAKADEFIGFAIDGAERMKRLINDLLGYSRVSNREMKLEAIKTSHLADAVVRTLSERIAETGTEFAIEPLPAIQADAMQMERLFLNLFENAIKYRGDAPPRIRVAAKPRDDFWEFSVADNGIGIAPEFHEKIFEIFTRLHSRDKYQGTGIGLASCKRIVERHGGTIWVEPAPGGGSIFRFTLPAVPTIGEKENAD